MLQELRLVAPLSAMYQRLLAIGAQVQNVTGAPAQVQLVPLVSDPQAAPCACCMLRANEATRFKLRAHPPTHRPTRPEGGALCPRCSSLPRICRPEPAGACITLGTLLLSNGGLACLSSRS